MLGDEMLIAMWHLQNVFRNAVMKKFSQIVISIYRKIIKIVHLCFTSCKKE